MSKVFNSKNHIKLENEERYRAIPPHDTLIQLGLRSNDNVADIGAGTGFFAVPASKIISPNVLYAVDISATMLNFMNERILKEGIGNIELLKMPPSVIPISNDSVTFTFCSFVVHEVPDYKAYISELLRITKPGGTVVILEWKKTETPFGPPLSHRISKDVVTDNLDSNSIRSLEYLDIGDWFYAIKAQKKL
jgi:ubiquinone/menaquinone biosynthesis C-methylase UbiE